MRTLSAFVRAKLPWLGEPVNAGSCPKRMLALSPVRNPSITDWDTNRTYRLRPNIPPTSIAAPAIKVSQTRASERWASGIPSMAEPAARAAALVVVITIILVLAVNPPAIRPTRLA